MQVRPIGSSDIGSAVALAERGFASPPTTTWAAFFDRLTNLQGSQLDGPIGYLLRKDDTDVGIILTLRSRRLRNNDNAADVVNLSTLYIDAPYRWYAPIMLKKILRDKTAIFTDLTASEDVRKLLPALKFKTWTEGVLTTSLPQCMPRYRRDVSVIRHDKVDPARIEPADRALLDDHAQMGCISCVMDVDGAYQPLIFQHRYRRKIPHAYLIYAHDREVVMSALSNICLHLLKHGHFLLALDCDEDESRHAGSFRKTSWHKYFNGPANTRGIDYAYSELVYLDCL